MAKLFYGAPVAKAILEDVSQKVCALKTGGTEPCLAVLRVGARPDDVVYESSVVRGCEKTGIRCLRIRLPENCSARQLSDAIRKLNLDSAVHGVLILRPLPGNLDRLAQETLSGEKDVDGITTASMAKVYSGWGTGFAPCTACACMEILHYYGITVSGKTAAVFGRSTVVGRPLASLLMQEDATVTVCHTKTPNRAEVAQRADILVSAVGHPGFCTKEYMHPEQILLDVGMNIASDGSMAGDADFEAAQRICGGVTPVPGGVGAVTTAVLLRHVFEAAEKTTE